MLISLDLDELKALYRMVGGYIDEFDFDESPFVSKDDIKLLEKLKKEIEYYDTTEQED